MLNICLTISLTIAQLTLFIISSKGEKQNGFDVLYQNLKCGSIAAKEFSEFLRAWYVYIVIELFAHDFPITLYPMSLVR